LRASSTESNHILFFSDILFPPEHHGKWYLEPFLEATSKPCAIAGGLSSVAVLPTFNTLAERYSGNSILTASLLSSIIDNRPKPKPAKVMERVELGNMDVYFETERGPALSAVHRGVALVFLAGLTLGFIVSESIAWHEKKRRGRS